MKLLVFTLEFPPFAGGAGVYSAGLAKGLASFGHAVRVLAPHYLSDPAWGDGRQPYAVDRMRLPSGRAGVIVGAMRLVWGLVRFRPRILFITEAAAQRAAALGMLLVPARVPYAVTVHGTEIARNLQSQGRVWYSRFVRWATCRLYRRARAVVCVSDYTLQLLLRAIPNLEGQAVAVQNGIDLAAISSGSEKLVDEAQHALTSAGPLLLTVARLIPEKGVDTVISLLPELLETFPDLRYAVVGTGPDLARLREMAEHLGVADHIVLAGKVLGDELQAWYRACDVFVMLSRPGKRVEGFGLVYSEAGAHGKPVVAARSGGAPEAVRDGYNGLVVDPGDLRGAKEAMARLLKDRELAGQMGRNGRALVEERFNVERMARDTLGAVLRACCGGDMEHGSAGAKTV